MAGLLRLNLHFSRLLQIFYLGVSPVQTFAADIRHRDELTEFATEEEQLVRAAQGGSREAFTTLRAIYHQRIYTRLLRITGNPEDAEDATQDCFLRAYLAIARFERRSSFYSWLTRIAVNSGLMILRKRRRRSELSLEFGPDADGSEHSYEIRDSAPDPEQICDRQQQKLLLQSSVKKLQPNLRAVIEVWMAEDCSVQEISNTLGISVAAVKSRLYRARIRIGTMPVWKKELSSRKRAAGVQTGQQTAWIA
jgi:RNA polymerase sigma-70 factor, ECF subfamily